MAKILIVDDSETIRQQVGAALAGVGHTLIFAEDGVIGLARAQENPDLSLVISDVNMPNMDGLSMIGRIRQIDSCKTKPVFVLTTQSSPELKLKGKEVGVTAWIVKPFDPAKLLAGVKKVLG